MGNGNASIEFVSENGPIDFSVMMQEGVKALTKILSTHLQDNPDLLNEKSMKVILKDNHGKLEPVFAPKEGDSEDIASNEDTDTSDDNCAGESGEEYEVIEFDNEGNYHVCAKGSENRAIEYIQDSSLSKEECGTSEEGGTSDSDNAAYSKKDQGLPKGMTYSNSTIPISPSQHDVVFEHDNGENTRFSPTAISEGRFIDTIQTASSGSRARNSQEMAEPCICAPENIPKGTEGYRYPQQVPHSFPSFKSLLEYSMSGKYICPFCEYYLVFGTPPVNMLRWLSAKNPNASDNVHRSNNTVLADEGYLETTNRLENQDANSNVKQTNKKKKKSKKKGKR